MKKFAILVITVLLLLTMVVPAFAQVGGDIWGDDCQDGSSPRLQEGIPEHALVMDLFGWAHGPQAQEAWEIEACAANGGRVRELNPNFNFNEILQDYMDDILFYLQNDRRH